MLQQSSSQVKLFGFGGSFLISHFRSCFSLKGTPMFSVPSPHAFCMAEIFSCHPSSCQNILCRAGICLHSVSITTACQGHVALPVLPGSWLCGQWCHPHLFGALINPSWKQTSWSLSLSPSLYLLPPHRFLPIYHLTLSLSRSWVYLEQDICHSTHGLPMRKVITVMGGQV